MAEDDASLRSVLDRGLRENGYVVDAVADGDAAIKFLRAYQYDVAILDWRMPKANGIEVLEVVRQQRIRTPILMLTARDSSDRPRHGPQRRRRRLPGEAVRLRRTAGPSECAAAATSPDGRPGARLRRSDLQSVDERDHRRRKAAPVDYDRVRASGAASPPMPAVVTRRTIATQVWDDEADAVGSNTIDVHIGRLRAKLTGSHARIETVRGSGYRLVAE